MDGIAEESGISILDDIRKVLGLTLNKFGSGSNHVHPLLRPAQRFRGGINANYAGLAFLAFHLLCDQARHGSRAAGHIDNRQRGVSRARCQ